MWPHSTCLSRVRTFPRKARTVSRPEPFRCSANRNLSYILYLIQFNPPRNYVMQWNLNVQRQIRPNTTVMLAYVGSRGIHMWYQTDDGNIVLPVAHTSDGYFWPSAIGSGTVMDPQTGRVPKSSWSADAYFHGLEAELLQRLTHNLQGQVSFTWSQVHRYQFRIGRFRSVQEFTPRYLLARPTYTSRTMRYQCHPESCGQRSVGYSAPEGFAWHTGVGNERLADDRDLHRQLGPAFQRRDQRRPMGLNSVIPFAFPDRLREPGCSQPINVDNPGNYIKLSCFSLPLAPAHPPVACTPFAARSSERSGNLRE